MRKIERHSSDEGSVVTIDLYGKEVKLFVADAKYRTLKPWMSLRKSGEPCGIDISTSFSFMLENICINLNNSPDIETQPLSYTMSDTQLQARFPIFKTDKTAKENTDVLMQYSDTDAAHWCRSIELKSAGALDLPNAYELMVVYLESDRLDELDPTVNEYRQFALGKLNPFGRFTFANIACILSSTAYSNSDMYCVKFNGSICSLRKIAVCGIVPVKEL